MFIRNLNNFLRKSYSSNRRVIDDLRLPDTFDTRLGERASAIMTPWDDWQDTSRLPTANWQATNSCLNRKFVVKTHSKHDPETIIILIDITYLRIDGKMISYQFFMLKKHLKKFTEIWEWKGYKETWSCDPNLWHHGVKARRFQKLRSSLRMKQKK